MKELGRELSERMKAICEMVTENSRVCDVGCDHGLVAAYLLVTGKASFVIASDLREKPLQKAVLLKEELGLTDTLSIRLADGLSAVKPGEVDTVIIAGMGGDVIWHILDEGMPVVEQAKELIISPHTFWKETRQFLAAHGFLMVDEQLITEKGITYLLIRCSVLPERKPVSLSEEEAAYGPVLLRKRDETLLTLLKKKKDTVKGLYENLPSSAEKRKQELSDEIALIDGVLREWYE